jgi:hypothetical protein
VEEEYTCSLFDDNNRWSGDDYVWRLEALDGKTVEDDNVTENLRFNVLF